jgi:hypothetical protein
VACLCLCCLLCSGCALLCSLYSQALPQALWRSSGLSGSFCQASLPLCLNSLLCPLLPLFVSLLVLSVWCLLRLSIYFRFARFDRSIVLVSFSAVLPARPAFTVGALVVALLRLSQAL